MGGGSTLLLVTDKQVITSLDALCMSVCSLAVLPETGQVSHPAAVPSDQAAWVARTKRTKFILLF